MTLILAALVLAIWRVPLFGSGLPLFGNLFLFYHPLIAQAQRQLQAGVFPLWNPYEFCGSPLLADPQAGVLCPLHVLFSLFPFPLAFRLELAADALLLALGAFLLARRAGLARAGALAAGLLTGCGGFAYYHAGLIAQVDSLALAPLVLLFWTSGDVRLAALALALQYLGGHPFFVYMTLAMAICVCPGRRLAAGVAASALALCLCAAQLGPAALLFRESVRPGPMAAQAALVYSVPPGKLLLMLLRPWWNRAASAFTGDPTITAFYAGLPALSLAALGLSHPRVGPARAWAAGGAALILGGFTPLYPLLLRIVPGLALFRFPAQWACALTLGLALLAAAGLQRLGRRARAWALALVAADLWVFCSVSPTARAQAEFYWLKPALIERGAVGGDRRPFLSEKLLSGLRQGSSDVDSERDWQVLVEALAPSHPTVFGVREIESDNIAKPAALERTLSSGAGSLLSFLGASVRLGGEAQAPVASPLPSPRPRIAWEGDLGGPIEVLEDAPDRLRLRVESSRGGFLTVADRLAPGWRAFVDGRAAPARAYQGTFRACAVPAGDHEVDWRYWPAAFFTGLAATLAAVFGLAAAGFLALRRCV